MRGRVLTCVVALAVSGGACQRPLSVDPATYRQAVLAFHTGLAAMQTSQDVLARQELERLTTLVPGEPAGWANLGLLLMRQQELDAAGPHLHKAAELAPKSAAVVRLLALLESRRGRLAESIALWRKATALDPADLRAPYALAQEIERQGGDLAEADAALEALLARNDNLAGRLELARLSAKRGDRTGLDEALAPLAGAVAGWPEAAQEQWRNLKAASSPAEAAPRVAFLKNVLLRTPEYRRALAAVSTPRDEVGEPLSRFVLLVNPKAEAAAPDEGLAFTVAPVGQGVAGSARPFWAGNEARPELVVVDGASLRLPGGAVLPLPGGARPADAQAAVVAADLDYDYRADLVLAGPAGVRLHRQEDGGRFKDVTAAGRLSPGTLGGAYAGAWPADVDTDGDLDVVLAATDGPAIVLRNNGDGTFAEQRPFPGVSRVRGWVWADLDGDGVPDAALMDLHGAASVFINLRGGVFQKVPVPADLGKIVAISAAEGSGDGAFDVLGLSAEGAAARLSWDAGRRAFRAATTPAVAALPGVVLPGSVRLLLADLDNSGAADLVVGGGPTTRIALAASGGWKALPAEVPLATAAVADLDADGRLELLGADAAGRPARATSRGTKAYGFQTLRPRSATATGDQRINSFGIGGEVEVRSGLHLQRRVIEAPLVHVGLGEAPQAEVIRVIWPNGIIQSEFGVKAGAEVAATQRLKGSCPWLFAWNGREMAFVTDLIWRSPLGLRINAQTTADVLMTEDWVKVRGDQLAPRDGAYDLRVTAELWETHFFDLVSLLAIDHPAGTEVFVDERFAIPAPKLEAVVTGPVQDVAAARDDRGQDVLATVRARDDRHLDTAGRGAYQGVTRDHFVEVELPDSAPRTGPLWLVAQGWVHPTDSSINVAMGQGKHPRPAGLSLHVADAAGRFREVRAGLGFPSGKDKTVLLDLARVFPAQGPRRLRVATNLEVFWDRIGWAEGRPDVKVEPRRLALASADLVPRGYSVTEQAAPSSPERPRYVLAGSRPRWLDLEGYHTRFGDVRELLLGVDDRYVIMNAGDEMRLRFEAAPPAAAGWLRDFVVVGDGWVKDGDYNTTFSRTVLPLPTHASGKYEKGPGTLEDDPVYRAHPRDFQEYHTRYVSPERARGALRPRG